MKTPTSSQLFQVTALILAIGGLSLAATAQDTPSAAEDEAILAIPWTEADTKLANHYIRLLERSPEYGNVLDLLWKFYEKKNQTPLLIEYFAGAASSGSPPPTTILIHAHLLRKNEQIDEARQAYDRVLDLAPETIPALQALAEIADLQNRTSKALSLYNRLLDLVGIDTENGLALRLRKAALHSQLQQTEAAVEIWKSLLKAYPDRTDLRTEIVSQLLEAGEADAAIEVLALLTESPDPRRRLEALRDLNRIYEFVGDFEKAVAAARKAMSLLHFKSQDYRHLFDRLVQIHEQFDRLDELEQTLQSAVSEENPTELSLYDLASFYQLTTNTKQEEAILESLVNRLPREIDYRIWLGRIQLRNDRFEDAAASLDAVLRTESNPPLHLVLLRAEVALNAEDREDAEQTLTHYLESTTQTPESLGTIIDFSRTNYLDTLVERLLVESTATNTEGPPLELARFLYERGRQGQAIALLKDYATEAPASANQTQRLEMVVTALRNLKQADEAIPLINEAITLEPENTDLLALRGNLFVETGQIENAISQFAEVWDKQESLEAKTEIDQRIFSLLRGHFAPEVEPVEDFSVLREGGIQTLAQYRKLAQIANKALRPGDDPPPQELLDYYENIKVHADNSPTLTNRYRAAWWAFKLQDNHECYDQLTTAKEEAGKPILAVEKLLFELAELNERITLMVDHLTTLAEIDPENSDDYLQRRAELRFELGYEDEAIRELKRLASRPEPPLNTLNTLARVYRQQGNYGKQIEVWQQAYRQANSFEKRRVIKQLTTALLENNRPEEALEAQLKLLVQESDMVQRRKQLDSLLNLARSSFLLEDLSDHFQRLEQEHPFDRFYPEAVARTRLSLGESEAAFTSLKKAYYMSEQNDALLDELAALAAELGNLQSAIYYRRQQLARGIGDQLENWKSLIAMMEKELRLDEANSLRQRLESRFGRNPEFLTELANFYHRDGQPAAAQRVLEKVVKLREWDLEGKFQLALTQAQRGDLNSAWSNFKELLEATANATYPQRFIEHGMPLIRVSALAEDNRSRSGNELDSLIFAVEDFPFQGGDLQNDIAEALQESHPEFRYHPKDEPWIRIRTIEEAASLASELGQAEAWAAQWSSEDRNPAEKRWALRHLGNSYAPALQRFAETLSDQSPSDAAIDQFALAYARLLGGDTAALDQWVQHSDDAGSRKARAATVAIAALILLNDPVANSPTSPATLVETLASLPDLQGHRSYFLHRLSKHGHFDLAHQTGKMISQLDDKAHPEFLFDLSQISGQAGYRRDQVAILNRTLNSIAQVKDTTSSRKLYVTALSDRLALADTDTEREQLVNRQLSRVSESYHTAKSVQEERRLLTEIAGQRVPAALTTLNLLMDRQANIIRPQDPDPGEVRYQQIQRWQQMDQLLHYYSARFPMNERIGPEFVEAMDAGALSPPVDDSAVAQYELFEIDRRLLPLEWLNTPERGAATLELQNQLIDPDSPFELGKALEARGFHREASMVYLTAIQDEDKSYAPVQALFECSAKSLAPEAAIEVIESFNSGDYHAPPGLTAEYLAEQHARFLGISRDFERLIPLSQKPTSSRGAPPITTRSHLPYQEVLIDTFRQMGKDDDLLRILRHLRADASAEPHHLLLGADALVRSSQPAKALDWLREIDLTGADPDLERRVMIKRAQLLRITQPENSGPIVALARVSLTQQPATVTRTLAKLAHESGATEDATSVLKLLRRQTSDHHSRFATTLLILQLSRQTAPDDLAAANEWETLFRHFEYQLQPGAAINSDQASTIPTSNATELIRWLSQAADPSSTAADQFEAVPAPTSAHWLKQLIIAWNRNELKAASRDLLENAPTNHRDSILATLPGFGSEGVDAAAVWVAASGLPGTRYFANQPAQRLTFFHRIGDRPRLIEGHHQLMIEAESDLFRQLGVDSQFATFHSRYKLPGLLSQLGENDLAKRLYRRYHDQISMYRWNHQPFLESYAKFLIETGQFSEAETLLRRCLGKSLDIDLRLVLQLYAAWDKLDSWEARTADLHLTSGRIVRLREWMTALAEGREMVNRRDQW